MRAVQPEGPYHFGGMCDGAHIAIRMAPILEQIGEQVGTLAVFDTWVLENSQRHFPWYIHYYSERVRNLFKLGVAKRREVLVTALKNRVKRWLGHPTRRSLWSQVYWPDRDFVQPIFSGRMSLFRRPKQPYYYVRDSLMGWGARALGGVDVHVLPIDHEEMLREPHVQILGQQLAQCLTKYGTHSSTQVQSQSADDYAAVASRGESERERS
jgi:thioesterase domain-containing protein